MTKFFLSVTGVERLWDGRRWERVKLGHFLTGCLGPMLKNFCNLLENPEDAQSKQAQFLAQIDTLLPSPPFYNIIDKRVFLESLLSGFLSLWTYNNRYYTAKQGLEEWERRQFFIMRQGKGKAHPALPYLQGSWRKCDIYPEVELGRKATRLGWVVEAPAPWDAAACELLLMIVHNIRSLKLCPECFTFHWEKGHGFCQECWKKKEREKKASYKQVEKRKTPEYRFLNLLSQHKLRGKLSDSQVEKLKDVLKKHGLPAAKAEHARLLKIPST